MKISTEGWQGKEVAHGAVLSRIYKPTMEVSTRVGNMLVGLTLCLGRTNNRHAAQTTLPLCTLPPRF